MNVGLPGAGIGGLFYLLCALFMPVKETFLAITRPGHCFRYRLVATQLGIAIGIVSGVIAVYELASSVFRVELSLTVGTGSILFYSLLPVLISLGLLLTVLATARIAGLFSGPHKSPLD
jgi:hypothetical protein